MTSFRLKGREMKRKGAVIAENRPHVWRERDGHWWARIPVSIDAWNKVLEEAQAMREAQRAIRIALEARDMIPTGTDVRVMGVPDSACFRTYMTGDAYLPERPVGVCSRRIGVGSHARVVNNDHNPRHCFPLGAVVEVVGDSLGWSEGSLAVRAEGPISFGSGQVGMNYQTVDTRCLEITTDPITTEEEARRML